MRPGNVFPAAVVAVVFLVGTVAWAQAPDLERMDVVLNAVPDGPVALVGGQAISNDEFRDMYVSELARISRIQGKQDLSDVERIEVAMNTLRILVERAILLDQAEKRNVTVTDAEVEAAWQKQVKEMGVALSSNKETPLTEQEVLDMARVSREEALSELRRTMVINKLRDEILEEKGVKVTKEEVAAFYEEHKDEAGHPDMVHALQIFVRAAPDPEQRAAVREKADKALMQLKSGQTFQSVASEVSDGPLKEAGGDVGPVPIKSLPESVQQQLAQMSPGDLSDVIESSVGFHIVKLVEFTAGKEPTLEEMGPQIGKLLLSQKGSDAVREFCSEATEGKNLITVFLDLDREIQARPDLLATFENAAEDGPSQFDEGEESL